MLFENLYVEGDRVIRRRWLISFGAALLLVLCYTVNAWITATARGISSPTEKSLLETQRHLKASALCSEFPKPEEFTLDRTRSPHSTSESARVFHGYRSDRDFDEVIPTYLIWFESNGWKRVSGDEFKSPLAISHPNRQMIFVKNKLTVNIIYYLPDSDGYVPRANYEFSCRYADVPEELSFAIYD